MRTSDLNFPHPNTVYLNIDVKLDENKMRLKQTQVKEAIDVDDTLKKIQLQHTQIGEMIGKPNSDKLEQLKELKKEVNALYRTANNIQKSTNHGGKGLKDLIQFIALDIRKKLMIESFVDPKKIAKILRGEQRTYIYETCTEYLSKAIGCHKNSFTGKGLYAGCQELGFILKKENFGAELEKSIFGRKVRLTIDLDWIFGFSYMVKNGNSVNIINNNIGNTDNSENGVENQPSASSDSQQSNQPTTSETNQVKGDTRQPDIAKTDNFGQKFSARAATAPAPTREVVDFAQKRWDECKKLIYNPLNLKNGRIRLNEVTLLTALNPENERNTLLLMVENYLILHQKDETWADTDARIGTAIERKAKYLTKNPQFYQYAPLMWLDPYMKAGTLRHYVEQYLGEYGENWDKNYTEKIEKPLKASGFDYISWFKAQGADPDRLRRLKRKINQEILSDAIRFGKCYAERGFKTDNENGLVGYIFGVINRVVMGEKHPFALKKEADKQQAYLIEKFMLEDEVKQRKSKRMAAKAAKNQEKEPKELWYLDRVLAMLEKEFGGKKLPNTTIDGLIQRGNERKAPEQQMYVWLSGAIKGTLKLQ